MRAAPDLGIPENKPAIELVAGRWEHKVTPQRRHALLQGRLWSLLSDWAGDRGETGTEWRFYLLPPGKPPSSLVPDAAYVSFERMPRELGELREKPTIAPDIAAEILSPEDRVAVLEEKIALYLECGTRLVIVVDPERRAVAFHEAEQVRHFAGNETACAVCYPDFAIELAALFRDI